MVLCMIFWLIKRTMRKMIKVLVNCLAQLQWLTSWRDQDCYNNNRTNKLLVRLFYLSLLSHQYGNDNYSEYCAVRVQWSKTLTSESAVQGQLHVFGLLQCTLFVKAGKDCKHSCCVGLLTRWFGWWHCSELTAIKDSSLPVSCLRVYIDCLRFNSRYFPIRLVYRENKLCSCLGYERYIYKTQNIDSVDSTKH